MKFPIPKKIKDHLTRRRHRRFLSLYDLPEKGSVLDISCGDGDFLDVLRSYFPKLDLHGIDISESYIARAKEKHPWAKLTVADAADMPYESASFDGLLSCMSLHHYHNPQKVFDEAARVLRPGGRLYVLDFIPRNRIVQILFNFDGCPEPYHFERYYLKREIEFFACAAGLKPCAERKIEWFSNAKITLLQKLL